MKYILSGAYRLLKNLIQLSKIDSIDLKEVEEGIIEADRDLEIDFIAIEKQAQLIDEYIKRGYKDEALLEFTVLRSHLMNIYNEFDNYVEILDKALIEMRDNSDTKT